MDALSQIIETAVEKAVRKAMGTSPTLKRRLLTVSEAGDYLSLCTRSVQEMVVNRKLSGVRYGRKTMIDIRDLDRWIEENKA